MTLLALLTFAAMLAPAAGASIVAIPDLKAEKALLASLRKRP